REDRHHGNECERRTQHAEAFPCRRTGGWKSADGEPEHPDTDDRYPRQLPNPVVGGGDEERDTACRRRGDLAAAKRERRANRTDDSREHRPEDEEQADDAKLAEGLEVQRMGELGEETKRTVLQPPGLPGSGAPALQRVSPEFGDRNTPELPAPAARARQ